jgi:hypothetical protein
MQVSYVTDISGRLCCFYLPRLKKVEQVGFHFIMSRLEVHQMVINFVAPGNPKKGRFGPQFPAYRPYWHKKKTAPPPRVLFIRHISCPSENQDYSHKQCPPKNFNSHLNILDYAEMLSVYA